MKKFFLLFVLLSLCVSESFAAMSGGAVQPSSSKALKQTTAVGEFTTITGTAGRHIKIYGFSFTNSAAGAQTFRIVYGTGTNCATGLNAISGYFTVPANSTLIAPIGTMPYYFTPSLVGQNVCVSLVAGTPGSYDVHAIHYVQE